MLKLLAINPSFYFFFLFNQVNKSKNGLDKIHLLCVILLF